MAADFENIDESKRCFVKGAALSAAGLLLPGTFAQHAQAEIIKPQRNLVASHAFMLGKGGPLHEGLSHNTDQIFYTASLIKLVTLAVALDEIAAGRLDPQEIIPISNRAKLQSSHRTMLDSVTVAEALEMAGSCSLNDVTIALAERIAAGAPITSDIRSGRYERRFVQNHMNALCQRLRMDNTLCTNATGLPVYSPDDIKRGYETMELPNSYSTMADLEKLVRYIATRHRDSLAIFSKAFIDIEGRRDDVLNTNVLLADSLRDDAIPCEGVFGMKSGYIYASGFNLICLKHQGDDILCTITSGDEKEERASKPKQFLDKAEAAYEASKPKPERKQPHGLGYQKPCEYPECDYG